GLMTFSTSIVLPVGPGTWWYRVRGFDYSLPTGAQQMSWSDPAELVVAQPKFKIVGGSGSAAVPTAKTKTNASAATKYTVGGISISVPAGWTRKSVSGSMLSAAKGAVASMMIAKEAGRGSRSFSAWTQALVAYAQSQGALGITTKVVHEPGGTAVHLSFHAAGGALAAEEYDFDAGGFSYRVLFDASTSTAATYRPVFAQMAATFRHA
ncbi:MAG TPA: hypothetical protein VN770_11070, partial [Gaiellaceae bacterium]|nr:hypothetical protein [Gaiellaceae bacterium]